MTRKLYYEDLYRTEFDAAVVSQEEREGEGVRVVLDRTLFYPGGGGQPCDGGTLGGRNVLEVLEEGSEIVHVLDGPLDGPEVHGVLDWARRFELMQQHLGQHILAAALHNRFSLHTARMRIEGDDVSMDIDNLHVDEATVHEAEAEANEVIWRDAPVEILYPPFEEVALHARKLPPKTSEPIRIVRVGGGEEAFDYVPCCGLHVRSAGEVGLIKVTALENHKGGTRVHLRCGRPAFRWLCVVCGEARRVQLDLACAPDGMFDRVQRLKEEIRDLKARNNELLDHAAAGLAEGLLREAESAGGYSLVAHVLPDSRQEDLKRLFRALTERPGVVALLGGYGPEGAGQPRDASLIFGCHRETRSVDVREAFQRALGIIGGKGGGAPFQAQGHGPLRAGEEGRLREALDAAAQALREALTRG